MPAVLVTGATGFVGRAACQHLLARSWPVKAAVRPRPRSMPGLLPAVEQVNVPSMGPHTDWAAALAGVDTVLHLAARVHVMDEKAPDPLAEFRRVNTAGTERLARMAADAGVRRLVFLSTIKVNGEETGSTPFTEADAPNPQDAYAQSKWEAEQALQRVAGQTGLEVVVLRPPLVYGPGVKGNFLRLLRAVDRGIPLPLAWAQNQRSLIFLGNLVDAIATCVTHPKAAGNTYLVSDCEDVSTAELISRIAAALGRPARLWPFPTPLIALAGGLMGKSGEVERLLGSLEVDCTEIQRELAWNPPYSMTEGLAQTAHWYRSQPQTLLAY